MSHPLNVDEAADGEEYLPDPTVYDPFHDDQDQDLPNDEDDGTSMAISEPNINNQGDVQVESSARSTKYSKVKSGAARAKTARQLSKA